MLKISLLGFIFLIWSGSIFTTSQIPSEALTTYETAASGTMFSRTYGLVADPANSSVIAFLNMLYSVPSFQAAFYAEADVILSTRDSKESRPELLKSSLVVATAVVFAHMRIGQEPLDLDTFYYEACQKAFGRPVKDKFIMIDRFSKAYFDQMPQRISSLYKHKSRVSFFNIPDFSLIGTITKELRITRYPLVGKGISLGNYIKQHFLEPTLIFNGPEGTRMAGTKVTTSEEIIETPEILFFEVPRLNLTGATKQIIKMNRENISFEKEITVNLVKYFLVGYSPFNHETSKYSLFTRDFGNMTVYEIVDGNVSNIYVDLMMETFGDDKTTFLVYARSDTLKQFDREEIKNFSDIPTSIKQLAFPDVGISNTVPIASSNSFPVSLSDTIPDDLLDFIAAEFASDVLVETSPVAPVYSGFSINPETSLIVPKLNSFMSSLFIAFYNIPDLQRAIYNDAFESLSENDKDISMKVAIAAAFAKMRLTGGKVDAADYLIETFSKESKTQIIGTFVRITSFAQKCSSFLGRNYREQVEIDCECKFINAVDFRFVCKSLRRPIFIIPLPISRSSPRSVSFYAQNNFEESKKTFQVRKSADESIEVYVSNKIYKSSKYLFLDINRVEYDKNVHPSLRLRKLSFDNSPIFIDSEIRIKEIDYILVARIEFDAIDVVYSTIIKDFHNSVQFKFNHDGTVQILQDVPFSDYPDTSTTFLIYAEKTNFYNSYYLPIELPETIKPVLQRIEEEQQQKSILSKRKRESSLPVNHLMELVYRPDYSKYPQNIHEFFQSVEKRISEMKAMNYPFLSMDFMSKYYYGIYTLGSEEYSFVVNSQSIALEVLLVQLAGSVRFVTALFEFLKIKKNRPLELNLAIVISRMLMGCKNIPLTNLLQEISTKSKTAIESFHATQQTHPNLNEQIQVIISQIDPSLVALPTAKKVIYPNLLTSDPSSVAKHKRAPVKASNFFSPTPADIRGAWFDSVDLNLSNRRIRTIYSSRAVIFPVEISRNTNNVIFFDANSMDRNSDGFICELSQEKTVYSYVLDKFSGKYRTLILGNDTFSYDPSNGDFFNFIQTRKLGYSKQLFMTSKDDHVQQVFSNIIPNHIIQLALDHILSESYSSTEDRTHT